MPMPQPKDSIACLETLFRLRRFGIKLGLATIRRILSGLDNPHRRYKTIHIAGTNGKGSVAAILANVLRCSGYRVGLYTSPHLVRFSERIQVDGAPITDEDIVRLYRRVHRVLPGGREPTFFEFTTAMAFDEFARPKGRLGRDRNRHGRPHGRHQRDHAGAGDHHEHLPGTPRVPGRHDPRDRT